MQGERNSLVQGVLLNPLVWIGLVLTGMTLANRDIDNAYEVFMNVETYRNLALGTAVYVGLFDRHYTKNMERLDIMETLFAVVQSMFIILITWSVSLALITGYLINGEGYKKKLTQRYQERMDVEETKENKPLLPKSLNNVELKSGQRYKVTPQDDGSIIIEVLDK